MAKRRKLRNGIVEMVSRRFLGARFAIYVLFDPRCPDVIRYVGKTKNWPRRLGDYKYPSRRSRTPVIYWCRKIRREGVFVCGRVIEWTADWESAERKWIAYFRAQGSSLLNLEEGGVGSWGGGTRRTWRSPLYRKIMSRVAQIIRRYEAKGDNASAEQIRWSCGMISRQRVEFGDQYGEKAVEAFDRDLMFELFPCHVRDGSVVYGRA